MRSDSHFYNYYTSCQSKFCSRISDFCHFLSICYSVSLHLICQNAILLVETFYSTMFERMAILQREKKFLAALSLNKKMKNWCMKHDLLGLWCSFFSQQCLNKNFKTRQQWRTSQLFRIKSFFNRLLSTIRISDDVEKCDLWFLNRIKKTWHNPILIQFFPRSQNM